MKKENLGCFYMIVSMGIFSLNETLYKIMSLEISPGQTLLWRSFFSLMFLSIYYCFSHERPLWKINKPLLFVHFVRGFLGFISILAMGYALLGIQVASFKCIFYLSPVVTILLLAFFLNEKVSSQTIKKIIVSGIGVCFLVTPGSEVMSFYGLLAFISMFLYSLVVCCAGRLKSQPPFEGLLFYVLICFIGCLIFEKGYFSPLSYKEVQGIVLMSVLHLGAYYLFLKALQKDTLQNLSPIECTGLIWSSLFAALLLSEKPKPMILFGGALIIFSQFVFRHTSKRTLSR